MTLIAKLKIDKTVLNVNVRTAKNRTGTRNVTIKKGRHFLCTPFNSTGMATHGAKCYRLKDGKKTLYVLESDVDVIEAIDYPYWMCETMWSRDFSRCLRCEELPEKCKCVNVHMTIERELKVVFDAYWQEETS